MAKLDLSGWGIAVSKGTRTAKAIEYEFDTTEMDKHLDRVHAALEELSASVAALPPGLRRGLKGATITFTGE